MKKVYFIVALFVGSSTAIAAGCTDKQKAKMIMSGIAQSVIDSTCGSTQSEKVSQQQERPIIVNITNTNANANTAPVYRQYKKEGFGSFGIGTYSLIIDTIGTTDLSASPMTGAVLIFGAGLSDLFSIASSVYSVEEDGGALTNNTFTLSATGFNAMAKVGDNSEGFTYFVGGGFFVETLDFLSSFSTSSIDINGTFFSYGIGYNWGKIALNLEGSTRSGTAYLEGSSDELDVTATTGSLNIATHF